MLLDRVALLTICERLLSYLGKFAWKNWKSALFKCWYESNVANCNRFMTPKFKSVIFQDLL